MPPPGAQGKGNAEQKDVWAGKDGEREVCFPPVQIRSVFRPDCPRGRADKIRDYFERNAVCAAFAAAAGQDALY